MEAEGFEEAIFDGVLDVVFGMLYGDGCKLEFFSPLFVNKRWNKVYMDHPLISFVQGRFNDHMLKFSPTYYMIKEPKVAAKLQRFDGMTKQIQAVTDEDAKQQQFIMDNILLHSFDFTTKCNNETISQMMNQIRAGMKESKEFDYYDPRNIAYVPQTLFQIRQLYNF
eukprot:TRINITY_DN22756_c0_g1_i1.p1 TRINITY_DN22756_c0_g1~~TRINITY_DN22756_c0_g1_i1.p1  ORF type:complete len:167 (-),score=31.46 TRINITY_DN22756_c0_g1_i1:356-856(-)